MAIMVREPFLEIRDYLETYDYSQPALRMVLYGKLGTGKTYTLAHLLHYAMENDWLMIAHSWCTFCFIELDSEFITMTPTDNFEKIIPLGVVRKSTRFDTTT